MTDHEALRAMAERLDRGEAVLVAGDVHQDLPIIQAVSHKDGARLKVDGAVEHLGFGFFSAKVNGDPISFDGGGAMRRADTFSWTPLVASTEQLDAMGYDLEAARAAVADLRSR